VQYLKLYPHFIFGVLILRHQQIGFSIGNLILKKGSNKMITLSYLVVISLLLPNAASLTENQEIASQDYARETQNRRTGILDDWANRGVFPAGSCINNAEEFVAALTPTTSTLVLNVCSETITIPPDASIQRAISTGLNLSYLKIDLRCNLPPSQGCQFNGSNIARIFIGTNTDLTITKFNFVNGSPDVDEDTQFGGAFYFKNSKITLIDCEFSLNYAVNGGAIYMEDSTLTLKGKTSFEQNTALDYGGALYLKKTKLIATDGSAEFAFNSATSYSSIYYELSTASLKGTKFTDNFDYDVSYWNISLGRCNMN
jgi:predicted outer membrane repeat protein